MIQCSIVTIDDSSQAVFIKGSLRSEDGDGGENVALKVISRSFNLHCDYSNYLLCAMQANSSGIESLRTISKFRRKKKASSWLVYVLLRT